MVTISYRSMAAASNSCAGPGGLPELELCPKAKASASDGNRKRGYNGYNL